MKRSTLWGLLIAGLSLAAAAAIVALSAWHELRDDFLPPRMSSARPSEGPLASADELAFEGAPGITIRGWGVPSRNGVAIVFLHGTGDDRGQTVPEATRLAEAGYGALAYDSPGHGASGGRVTWGAGERAALRAAITRAEHLAPQGTVARVGVVAMSMGALIAIQEIADDERVRAAVLAGVSAEYKDVLLYQNAQFGLISGWTTVWTARAMGMTLGDLEPRFRVAAFGGRPLLLIAGAEDTAVPSRMTRALFEAAREPKQFWEVPGARHCRYAQAAGSAYGDRLVDFFNKAFAVGGPVTQLRRESAPTSSH